MQMMGFLLKNPILWLLCYLTNEAYITDVDVKSV